MAISPSGKIVIAYRPGTASSVSVNQWQSNGVPDTSIGVMGAYGYTSINVSSDIGYSSFSALGSILPTTDASGQEAWLITGISTSKIGANKPEIVVGRFATNFAAPADADWQDEIVLYQIGQSVIIGGELYVSGYEDVGTSNTTSSSFAITNFKVTPTAVTTGTTYALPQSLGGVYGAQATRIAAGPNATVLVAGTNSSNIIVARVKAGATMVIDPTFGGGGAFTLAGSTAKGVFAEPDGSTIVVIDNKVVRLWP